MLKDWNWETPMTEYWVSTTASKTTRRINFYGKSSSKNLDKKYPWNGKNNRAQELGVEEFSVQKLREGHETNAEAHFKKTINARANELWIIQMNFQEVESYYSGGLSYVSSQPAVPLDTWNTSGQQGKRFW